MDIRQSSEYGQFMKDIGWQVEKIGRWQAFIKKFPLISSLIKIQRISAPVPFKEIENLAKKHRSFKTIVEFNQFNPNYKLLITNYSPCSSPFLPTKTIQIDLIRSEKDIFNSFSPEKRRAIRKAKKNGVFVKEGNAEEFIFLKRKSLLEKFILPIGDKKDILALDKSFSPDQIVFFVAHHVTTRGFAPKQSRPLAGILLLFYQKTAYYWQAASLNKGKKLACPSLLVWEALKLSKQKGCDIFDFEGIYDERFPNKSWLGFSRFKSGFGGKEIEFPPPMSLKNF